MIIDGARSAHQMLIGNILLIGCCVFYLLWWTLAFKPGGAVKGIASGWLLIPAFVLGIAAVAMIIIGARGAGEGGRLFSGRALLVTGAVSYAVLLFITYFIFHRRVTSELFLIAGWALLAAFEVSAFSALGILPRAAAVALVAAALVFAAGGIVCYVLYYRLSPRASYIDGMIPLILVALYTAALAALSAVSAR